MDNPYLTLVCMPLWVTLSVAQWWMKSDENKSLYACQTLWGQQLSFLGKEFFSFRFKVFSRFFVFKTLFLSLKCGDNTVAASSIYILLNWLHAFCWCFCYAALFLYVTNPFLMHFAVPRKLTIWEGWSKIKIKILWLYLLSLWKNECCMTYSY